MAGGLQKKKREGDTMAGKGGGGKGKKPGRSHKQEKKGKKPY